MAKRRDPLPRLNIVQNPNVQQAMGGPGGGFYSPALPTSIQQNFHPTFPAANPLQTPMQSFFTGPPGAPGRPMHHAHQASIQLAAAGIHPPNYATPVTGHFPRPSMMLGPGGHPQASSHPYPNRNRRQLSIGGPPKAVLGGPARKVSPMPVTPGAAPTPSSSTPAPPKAKKMVVNLPKETVAGEDGQPATRPEWARSPLANTVPQEDIQVPPVEISTAESYPPDSYRLSMPAIIDVYLPGKLAWDAIKKMDIEEKLEKLGVEPGSGSNIPHIHAPHARAASISSPADPALLLFKLNKLQRTQDASSAGTSLSASPQPPFAGPFGLSPSPRFLTNRHGHSMSLAPVPSYQAYSSSPSPFNPFGINAVLGTDSVAESVTSESSFLTSSFQNDPIHAPQGRVPMNFAPPLSVVGAIPAQIDFNRGFGLDVPLESEEEEEEEQSRQADESGEEGEDRATLDVEEEFTGAAENSDLDDNATAAPQSRMHSRHVSKLSAALSLRSVGGNFQAQFPSAAGAAERQEEQEEQAVEADQSEADADEEPDINHEDDPTEEWTGSEDLYLGLETSDDESIGEWSNPSDEERARQQRVERRMRRSSRRNVDQPRRLPDFPRPPQTALGFQSREDDIISNPSEENLPLGARRAEFLGVTTEEYYPEAADNRTPQSNPFGVPAHSRGPSSPYSIHDPAMAHSRQGSGGGHYGYMNPPAHRQNLSGGLNPLAKPFVFGQPLPVTSGSWAQAASEEMEQAPSMPVPVSVASGSGNFSPLHTRLPSLGTSLNVAAPEFKPGAFHFRLPGAPAMPVAEPAPPPFPEPQLVAPLALEPSPFTSPFKVQGREKRQRRLSENSVEDENDSMTAFKFPMKMDTSSPNVHHRRRSRSLSSAQEADREEEVNKPFTFAGFNAVANNMPWVPKESDGLDVSVEESMNDSSTAKGDHSELQEGEMLMPIPMPTPARQKRAPIPLDFTHPVSSNTVPAGVFKALINSNEDRTRRSVRPRLDSREIFEHSRRPSMDDDHVALIAHRNPQRSRLVTDPGERLAHAADDVFGSVRHARRRSSLPDTLGDNESSPDQSSTGQLDLGGQQLSLHDLESVIAQLLDEKLGDLRHHIVSNEQKTGKDMVSTAEEVIAMFRTQLQDSAMRGFDNSMLDARGDVDFQVLKEIVEEGHVNLLSAFQQEVHQLLQSNSNASVTSASQDVLPAVEEVSKKTVDAVVEAISELSVRQEAMSRNAPAVKYDFIVDKVVGALSPMLNALHHEPIDYDFLTHELTQSVKPHISQLIDLASDKRETAGLIVERILPHLVSLKPVPIDTDAITLKLITEVRRAIAPIDAFEIKEQVADLVVERLDSRLAVRDKATNVDAITSKVIESIGQLRESVGTMPAAVDKLTREQTAFGQRQNELADVQSQILASVLGIPSKVEPQLEEVKSLQHDILEKLNQPAAVAEPDANILLIKGVVEAISTEQRKLVEKSEGSISESKNILDKLTALPDSFSLVAKGIENSLTEFITSRDSSKRELEELRQLNGEYQVQLTKARGSHGQVRVEKDALVEKFGAVEGDRDRLQAQVKELQTAASAKTAETSTLKTRNAELEDALAKALARLQSADVVAENNQRTIVNSESSSKDLTAENQKLKSRVDSLDREVVFAQKGKEAASNSLAALQTKYDALVSQQSNWDALNTATEKINLVFNLLENADSEEQKELRHYRDHCKTLEDENAAMQKRFKDADSKLANSERSGASLRQTLTQAQLRSEEWERLAKAAQGSAEMLETKLEQAEQTQSQLDADYQLVKVQLDEKEADSRLQADRAMKLQQQVVALESKCSHLQSELEKSNANRLSSAAPPFRPRTNGTPVNPLPRPNSRASTIYDGRSESVNRRVSSYTSARSSVVSPPSGPEPSVRDSMHAPRGAQQQWAQPAMHTPVSRYSSLAPATPKAAHTSPYPQYARGPSPTPSTVSAVPTQGDDGWWS